MAFKSIPIKIHIIFLQFCFIIHILCISTFFIHYLIQFIIENNGKTISFELDF